MSFNENMYNNHQGVYTIRGDMCYENKGMNNSALPSRLQTDSVCLNIAEHDRPQHQHQIKKRKNPKFRLGYLLNIIIIIIFGVIVALIEFGYFPQTTNGFYCKDPSISHPYRGDTISATCLLLVSFIFPIFIFLLVEYTRVSSNVKLLVTLIWRWYREFLISLGITMFVIEIVKCVGGELRPHFLDTCSPDVADTCINGSYVTDYVCTNQYYKRSLVTDSSRSFPSGHAAVSVFASIFCAVYINHRFITKSFGMLAKPFLIGIVLVWGPTTALSRVIDHRHHWWDVLAGSVLGIAGAYYGITALCKKFQVTNKDNRSTRPSASTTTLLDIKNKDATSVII